jgi:hypothetical protein
VTTEVEATEVDAVWVALIGERGEVDAMAWWTHLSTRRALLIAVSVRIGDELAALTERWHRDGDSFATIGARVGLSRGRAQQLVEQGRRQIKNGEKR